jgi:hypothetical protein
MKRSGISSWAEHTGMLRESRKAWNRRGYGGESHAHGEEKLCDLHLYDACCRES